MSAPVDVLAVMERSSQLHWNHNENGDAEDAEAACAAVTELITELRNAHEIIKLALNHVPAEARSQWFLAIDDAGLCGDGVTRFHERQDALARAGVPA